MRSIPPSLRPSKSLDQTSPQASAKSNLPRLNPLETASLDMVPSIFTEFAKHLCAAEAR
jgi:hypothetical protein